MDSLDSPCSATLQALEIALFQRSDSGTLLLANTAPVWLSALWPGTEAEGVEFQIGVSPFLANFLIDAELCWNSPHGERIQSGPWIEVDAAGREVPLEATALVAAGRPLLLVERLGKEFDASKAVLQKARETMMAYQRLSEPQSPEITLSLDRLRERYPNYSRCGFLIMSFAATKPYARIVSAIIETAQKYQLHILRADAHEFHSDLLSNIRTYLHGCSFGVAIYDRIRVDEANANVGFEAGYMMAMNKPVLLLKDETLPAVQTDLAGKLYKGFDPHDPANTIPPPLEKWLEDYGIIIR